MRNSMLLVGMSTAWLFSCGKSPEPGFAAIGGASNANGGNANVGGALSTDGNTHSGGNSTTTGDQNGGANANTGSGGDANGGNDSTPTIGGTPGNGGSSTNAGGATTTGGKASGANTGGAVIVGGAAAAGKSGTGGKAYTGGTTSNLGGAPASGGTSSTGPIACDRPGLTAAVDAYLSAVQAGDSAKMPLTSAAKYTENGAATAFAAGTWTTPLPVDYHFNLIDTAKCGAFTYVIVTGGSHPYVLGTRIDVSGSQISKVTTIAIDCDDHGFSATGFLKAVKAQDMSAIPADQQYTNQQLYDEAAKYFAYWADKSVVVPWGTNCKRLEGGAFNGPCNGSIPNGTAAPRANDWLADPESGFVALFLNMPGPDAHLFRITRSGGYAYIDTVTLCYDSKHCYTCPLGPPAINTCPADILALSSNCTVATVPDGGCKAFHEQGVTCSICHQKSCTCETQDQNCHDIAVCASPATPIDTPKGARPISSLKPGDLVYSVNEGAITAVPIERVRRTLPNLAHKVMRVALANGTMLEVSAPHPTADGRSFGDLRTGDRLGGVPVVAVEQIPYRYTFTYDILPASDSGTYFAGGAWIGSTIRLQNSAARGAHSSSIGHKSHGASDHQDRCAAQRTGLQLFEGLD